MNVYYKNEKAMLSGSPTIVGSSLLNVYDSALELKTDFVEEQVTISGNYNGEIVAVDSLCLGLTNAFKYELITSEGTFVGRIDSRIVIVDFAETFFIDSFELRLESIEPVYLGLLYIGKKVVLPRFEVGPEVGTSLNSESSRSFGGQAYGMRRKTLGNFAANFPRITSHEKNVFEEYINFVINIESHIIDPYPEARDEFPPMYATLNINEVSLKKLNEPGFFYSGSLSWKEAR